MQHREIPVASVQVRAHDRGGFASAWPHVLQLVDEAGEGGAKLIVLPEGTVPGYVLGNEPVQPDLLANAAEDLALAARRFGATIVYGAAKIIDGQTYNAAIVLGPDGRELGFAAKQFLWHFDRRWYAPGYVLAPIATPVGTLGVLVCADGRIPSIAATLCDRGADALVMPTAWVTSGRDPHSFENVQADLMAAVRARENAVPFVVANKVGIERESVAYCGKSAIFCAEGERVAGGDEAREVIVRGTIAVGGRPRPLRRSFGSVPEEPRPHAAAEPARLRIAFTPETSDAALARLRRYAADADADLLLAPEAVAAHAGRSVAEVSYDATNACAVARMPAADAVHDLPGCRVASVTAQTLRSPRALVAARLAGIDCFVWHADGDAQWHVPFARTRAAELRAYVVVFTGGERSFVVDPDGVVAAGTFAGLALSSFVYDRARTGATLVAPTTDVLAGLRIAESIAGRALAETAGA